MPGRNHRKNDENEPSQWIKFVINNPIKEEVQSDGRIKKWAKINEVDKYLRVILLEDGMTVHNAFFDKSFKEE
ncbi:MAG: hypothetical protein QME81_18375 [bacterium]|nr:hypothetical protein [bacterium]